MSLFSKPMHLLSCICLLFSMSTCGDQVAADVSKDVPAYIKKQTSGKIEYKSQFSDQLGQHFLVLVRDYKTDSDNKETIALKAQQFLMVNSEWKPEWIIQDKVDCQGLDIDGNFFTNLVSLTDLDSNKIIETTIAYFLVCAGDVEPKLTKAIMRQGKNKYAVRGESFIRIDEKTSYGGTFSTDSTLNSQPEIKTFLIALWKKAANVN